MKKAVVALLAVFAVASVAYWLSLSPEPVTVTVGKGGSARRAASQLKEARVISSENVFLALLKLSGKSQSIKAGTYELAPRMSVFEVIAVLTSGRTAKTRITIPEGYTAKQIAELLGSKGLADENEALGIILKDKLEGYLFPDTYFVDAGASAAQILGMMRAQFDRNYTDEMRMRAKELRMTDAKIVTLASIIEKEAARAEERPVIAGIFYNRLKKGWFLESCATVQYALGKHKEKLTIKDLAVNSPYNTYRKYGLPPGPICNPGRDSINAALYPAQTEDMFFVVSENGSHAFSRYYGEHLKNKKLNKKSK